MPKKKHEKEKITVRATPAEYNESGACCGWLTLWACSAFGFEATPENMRNVYRLAWARARDGLAVDEFKLNPGAGA